VLTETYALHRKRLGPKYALFLCLGCILVWDLLGRGALPKLPFPLHALFFIGQLQKFLCNGLKYGQFIPLRK
jgi:hypothetical protein